MAILLEKMMRKTCGFWVKTPRFSDKAQLWNNSCEELVLAFFFCEDEAVLLSSFWQLCVLHRLVAQA
jgi:hypothetical protein